MPAAKSKVPEYPRPVSPVSAEEYPICDETIVYSSDPDDAESTTSRAAKRQRVESYATSYLRGEPLFILSAQLEGPFRDGWRNPWSRSRKRKAAKHVIRLEVPETTFKPRSQERERASPADRNSPPRLQLTRYPKPATGQPPNNSRSTNRPQTVKSTTNVPIFSERRRSSKDKEVEEWLRKDQSFANPEDAQLLSSPTPLSRHEIVQVKKWESPVIDVELPLVPDEIVTIPALSSGPQQHDAFALESELSAAGSAEAKVKGVSLTGFDGLQAARPPSKTSPGPPTAAEKVVDNCARKFPPHLKAENGTKRRSLHTIPPSSHLPAFEYRRVSKDSPQKDEPPTCARDLVEPEAEHGRDETLHPIDEDHNDHHDLPGSLYTAKEALPCASIDMVVSSISKDHSKASLTNDLPSAQIPLQGTLQRAPSNLSGTGNMLDELVEPPALPVPEAIDDDRSAPMMAAHAAKPQQQAVAPSTSYDQQQGLVISAGKSRSLQSDTTPKPDAGVLPDTQQMLESITPFTLSTIKKNDRIAGPLHNSTPETVTKPGNTNKRKRASFVTEEASSGSSHVSIKAVMKVAKTSRGKADKIGSSKEAFLNGGEGEDENSIHHIPDNASPTKNQGAKGILKSSSNVSTGLARSAMNIISSSSKQDAQKVRALAMVASEVAVEQDSFDLDAAMDDLGSFLGPWDAEKEAQEMSGALV